MAGGLGVEGVAAWDIALLEMRSLLMAIALIRQLTDLVSSPGQRSHFF
jgi:hypothetical protein